MRDHRSTTGRPGGAPTGEPRPPAAQVSGQPGARQGRAFGPSQAIEQARPLRFAEYGCCASHSRYFWGLRLHLLCTVHGLPVGFALTGAKADERHTLLHIIDSILTGDPDLVDLADRDGQTLIADKNNYGRCA